MPDGTFGANAADMKADFHRVQHTDFNPIAMAQDMYLNVEPSEWKDRYACLDNPTTQGPQVAQALKLIINKDYGQAIGGNGVHPGYKEANGLDEITAQRQEFNDNLFSYRDNADATCNDPGMNAPETPPARALDQFDA